MLTLTLQRLPPRPLRAALVAFAAAALAGCVNLAPKYRKPQPPVPAQWPQGPAYGASGQGLATASEVGWRQFYADDRLRSVVGLSVASNRDLRIATLNIERARALYRIQPRRPAPDHPPWRPDGRGLPASLSPMGTQHALLHDYRSEVGFSAVRVCLFVRVRNLRRARAAEYLATGGDRSAARTISLVAEVAAAG